MSQIKQPAATHATPTDGRTTTTATITSTATTAILATVIARTTTMMKGLYQHQQRYFEICSTTIRPNNQIQPEYTTYHSLPL